MKLAIGILLATVALAQAERDWSKIFPNHLPTPPGVGLPQGNGIVNPRIVGGNESVPHSRPYQAGLFLPVQGGTSFCGGSLLNTRTVLTAAHCVDSLLGPVQVVLGAHNIQQAESTQQTILSDRIIVHPDWNRPELLTDVALIHLAEPARLNNNVQTIDIVFPNEVNWVGRDALVSGWGRPSDSVQTISPVLREVVLPIINQQSCNTAYFGSINETSHICASGTGGRSTCNGDSGGPLVIDGHQVGIVSFGISFGCEVGWPAVFARVSTYSNWIRQNSAH